ncbi:MAG: glycosyltransferase family 9 protein [Planctomycetota bacterium]|nr:MAG: glycosyltransferase family 9 protein [Planctomycetota bacterium]
MQSPIRMAIFLPTWVGDCCMATPTLRAIRRGFPRAQITAVMRPVIADLLDQAWGEAPAWYDEMVMVPKKTLRGRLAVAQQLRQQQIDVGVLLTNSLWSAAAVRISGAPARIGYARDGRGWLLTSALRPLKVGRVYQPVPHIDYLLAIAEHMGCPASDRRMQLAVTDDGWTLRRRLLARIGWDESAAVAVINNGAATQPDRIWPEERVRRLALDLAEQRGLHVLLHCGPADRESANRIAAQIHHPRVASMGLVEELPIALSKAVLASARVVISTDSGPRHIAAALDRPVVALFGATGAEWTRTYNVPEQIVTPPSGDEAIAMPRAAGPRAGMARISVEQVLAAVDQAMASAAAA